MTFINGRDFAMSGGRDVPSIWGHRDDVAWAEGEPLMIVAPSGVGKTTVAQQLVRGRLGIGGADSVLGLPVAADPQRPVLYIAADRPRQIARSLRRMVTDDSEARILEQRLIVWIGPTTHPIDASPEAFAKWVTSQKIGTLVIDSLKDVAGDLASGDVGTKVNRALQLIVAAGVEVLVLHHQRKAQADNRRPRTLSDVYGSAWLTAGAGSVVLLWGQAGDPVVELAHLKQPAGDIGPLKILHDHTAGQSSVLDEASLSDLLKRSGQNGLTPRDAARLLYGNDDPGRNDIEKARRKLKSLRNAVETKPSKSGDPSRYHWAERDPRDPQREGSREASRQDANPDEHGSRDPHAPSHTSRAPSIEGGA